MNSPDEARQQAKQLVASQSWADARPLLEELWSLDDHRLLDSLPLIKVLRKLNKPKLARDVARQAARELKQLPEKDEEFWRKTKAILYTQAAWTIYDMEVKGSENAGQLGKACWDIRRTLEEGGGDRMDPYAPWVRSMLSFTKQALVLGQSANALKELEFADPARLSSERWTPPNGKPQFSDREQWYLRMAKALDGEQLWEKLKLHCEAGRSDQTFGERTSLFLGFRLAHALLKLGEGKQALEHYRILLAHKREWWIGDSYAHALGELGERKLALREGLIALLDSHFFEGSVNLALTVGELALAEGGAELAGLCRQFVEVTRQAHGWPIKEDLQARLDKLPTSDSLDAGKLQQQLRHHIYRFLDEIDPPREGVLQSILPNGKMGFVREDSGESHALFLRGDAIKQGDRLTFRAVPNWDRKKERMGSVAIHVRKE
jgi:hypothetical protein